MRFEVHKSFEAKSFADVVYLSIKEGATNQKGVFRAIQEHLKAQGRKVPTSESHFTDEINDLLSGLYDKLEWIIPVLKASGQTWIVDYLAATINCNVVPRIPVDDRVGDKDSSHA